MLGQLLLGHPLDFDTSPDVLPGLGRHRRVKGQLPRGGRLIKSHERLAFPYASRCRPFIYLVRDGRDVAVSQYFWYRRRIGSDQPFDEFLMSFLAGTLDGYGPWHVHIASWLKAEPADGATDQARALIMRYEDLLHDPRGELGRAATFLGLAPSAKELDQAISGQRLESMRAREQRSSRVRGLAARPDVPYVRRGKTRQWTDAFSESQREEFERRAGHMLQRFGYL
jgi:hypothetical protein